MDHVQQLRLMFQLLLVRV